MPPAEPRPNPDERASATPPRAQQPWRRSGQRLSAEARAQAQVRFLAHFADTANVRASCAVAGVERSTVHRWQKSDRLFAERYREAELDAADTLRAEMWRRGKDGWEEPLVSQGQLVYEMEPVLNEQGDPLLDAKGRPLMRRGAQARVRKYDSALLLALGKAHMPELRERTHLEVTGKDGGPIQIEDARERLAQRLAAIVERRGQSAPDRQPDPD